jgi:hypothetical protein
MIALAFFDRNVSVETKIKMLHAMMNRPADGSASKRRTVDLGKVAELTLPDFVTLSAKQLIDSLMLPTDYLSVSPAEWKDRQDYQAAVHRVQALLVVSDFAERGIALIHDYNSAITTDEEQKQYVLQTVENHRKKFPDSRKSTVCP